MRLDLMALRSSKSGYAGTSIRWFVSTASSYKGSFTRDRRIDEDQSSTQAHGIFYFFKADAWDNDIVSTEQYNEDKRHACVDYGRIHRPHDFIHRLLPATFEGTLRVKERYLRAAGLQQFARRVQGLIEAVDFDKLTSDLDEYASLIDAWRISATACFYCPTQVCLHTGSTRTRIHRSKASRPSIGL